MEIARRKTKLFIYLWPALGLSGALHYCSNPLSLRIYEIYVKNHNSANVSKILPIAGWFPWDSVQYYRYSYLIQVFGVVGCCVGTVSYDQLYVSTLLVSSSYLKHLIYSLTCETNGLKNIRYVYKHVLIVHSLILVGIHSDRGLGLSWINFQTIYEYIKRD